MKNVILVTALAAMIGTASAKTSDDWTFEEWALFMSDDGTLAEETVEVDPYEARYNEFREQADTLAAQRYLEFVERYSDYRNRRANIEAQRLPYPVDYGRDGWSPYGNY